MSVINKIITQYISVIIAAMSGMAFVTVVNLMNGPGAIFLTEVSVLLGLFGLLAFNMNYVLIIRAGDVSAEVLQSEIGVVIVYRTVMGYLLSGLFFIFFDYSYECILYFLSRASIESILNTFRAKYDMKNLNKYSFALYSPDLFLIVFYYFSYASLEIVVWSWFLVHILSMILCIQIIRMQRIHLSVSTLKKYAIIGMPLVLSSVREFISGHGLIVLASTMLSAEKLIVFNTLTKLIKVPTILFTSISNFFIQQLVRNQLDTVLLSAISLLSFCLMVVIYFFIDTLLGIWSLQNNFGILSTIGIFVTPICIAGYSLVQMFLMSRQRLYTVWALEIIVVSLSLVFLVLFPLWYIIILAGLAHLMAVIIFVTNAKLKGT